LSQKEEEEGRKTRIEENKGCQQKKEEKKI